MGREKEKCDRKRKKGNEKGNMGSKKVKKIKNREELWKNGAIEVVKRDIAKRGKLTFREVRGS